MKIEEDNYIIWDNKTYDDLLLAIVKHTDEKMEIYFKELKAQENTYRLAQIRHMDVVEGYLKVLTEIVKAK